MFATGKRALGICDKCGFRCALSSMRTPTVAGHATGALVCADCYDPDHPQNFQGQRPVVDAEALRVTRPDVPEAPVTPLVLPPVYP